MPTVMQIKKITPEEYLSGELFSQCKHELIEGYVYAMAGASANHERISGNVYRKFGNHLESLPCEPFGSDMKVRVGDNFFYPDVLVDCSFDESQPYYTQTPVIIVEVISRSTRKTDEQLKRLQYTSIVGLKEYVLIEQDFVDITVFRENDSWRPTHYFLGEDILFESIELTLSVEEIYHRVHNEDMIQFLQDKEQEQGS